MRGDRVVLDVEPGQQPAEVVVRNDHADRAGDRRRLGIDRLGLVADRHRDVVPAAGRHAPHADDERNVPFLAQLVQVVIDVVGAGDGAAGRIDPQHDRLDVLVLANLVDLLLDEAVARHDHPFDREDGDLVGAILISLHELLFDPSGRVRIVRPGRNQAVDDQAEHDAAKQASHVKSRDRKPCW